MSRPWRIEYEGALYHLLSRGNGRNDMFIDEKDSGSFLNPIGEMSERFAIDIFAYVLMDNHALCEDSHTTSTYYCLRSGKQTISTVMRMLLTGYAVSYNRRHRRSGHLFQNRFKSILLSGRRSASGGKISI